MTRKDKIRYAMQGAPGSATMKHARCHASPLLIFFCLCLGLKCYRGVLHAAGLVSKLVEHIGHVLPVGSLALLIDFLEIKLHLHGDVTESIEAALQRRALDGVRLAPDTLPVILGEGFECLGQLLVEAVGEELNNHKHKLLLATDRLAVPHCVELLLRELFVVGRKRHALVSRGALRSGVFLGCLAVLLGDFGILGIGSHLRGGLSLRVLYSFDLRHLL
mmetsp:Transcript_3956/g.8464  ORF Transcript_3956/g.8464 Transcript_3956/m.8464 type:complete len:219 (-) Transcript_3956:131-787(-)